VPLSTTREHRPSRAVLSSLTLVALLVGSVGFESQRARAQSAITSGFVPGQLIVRFTAGDAGAALQELLAKLGGTETMHFATVDNLFMVSLPTGVDVMTAAERARELPTVAYAEPNYVLRTSATPNDPRFVDAGLWGLNNAGLSGGTPGVDIDAVAAWNMTTGSRDVVVAVIDTGIDYSHPDLAANMFRSGDCTVNGVDDDGNGYVDDCHGIDTANHDADPMDDHNHGTHTAGTIGAVGNNGVGVSGVNWRVQLMACKFLAAGGSGSTADAVTCLDYVADMKDRGVNIVATNNSWGGGGFSQALYDAIDGQRQRGILFIAAAGNGGSDAVGDDNDVTPTYPANYDLPNVLTVASTTRTDTRSTFSNYGQRTVHLGAPGSSVLSTTRGNTYSVFSGTSMATPHVTGVAALLKAQSPGRDWIAIRNLILAGGEATAAMHGKTVSGRRLSAFGALSCSNTTLFSRLKPSLSTVSGVVGRPVAVSALHINCAAGAGATVTVAVSDGSALVLRDNGVVPDQVAGDGVFSANFVPLSVPSGNRFVLTFPGGDTASVQMYSDVPYTDAPTTYSYRSITGTNLNLTDDTSARVESPFPLLFAGSTYDALYVSSNGTLNFAAPFDNFLNLPLPLATPAGALLAPFWDDLLPVSGDATRNVYWAVTGAAPSREFVVEWRNVPAFGCVGGGVTFQVVFLEGRSSVLFNYADTLFGEACVASDKGASATIGVQVSAALATQRSFNTGVVGSGTALLWTYGTTPRTWTDDTLISTLTPIRAAHINELRVRIDALRTRFGLAPTNWTNAPVVAGSTPIRTQHLVELRVAVTEAYRAAGVAPRAFGALPTSRLTLVRVDDISQLRAAVDALESAH